MAWLWNRIGVVCAAAVPLVGCGPKIDAGSDETGTDATTVADPSTSTSTSGGEAEAEVDDGVWEPDISGTGDPPPQCSAAANGLDVIWQTTDPARIRAEAVSVGPDGIVAWTATDFDGTTVHAYETESLADLWQVDTEHVMGEGDLTMQDVLVTDESVVLGGVTFSMTGIAVGLRWFDLDGQLVESIDTAAEPGAMFGGLAPVVASVVVAGSRDDAVSVARLFFGGLEWEAAFGDDTLSSEFGTAVAVDSTGAVYVVGHVNSGPAPLVLRFSPEGELLWSIVDEDTIGDYGLSVAVDTHDRAVVVSSFDGGGVIRRYGPEGDEELEVPTIEMLHGVAVDHDGRIVVIGHYRPDGLVVVQRRYENGDVMQQALFEGNWGFDVAVDDECHVWAVGEAGGAWVAKLQ